MFLENAVGLELCESNLTHASSKIRAVMQMIDDD